MNRIAPALPGLAVLLLGACAEQNAPRSLQAAEAGGGQEAALRRQCEAEAERAVNFRERGQSARDDASMLQGDATNNIPTLRIQADAYNRRVLREDLIRECVRANTAGPRPQDPPPPATTTRGRRN
jgi:hypothetical protein